MSLSSIYITLSNTLSFEEAVKQKNAFPELIAAHCERYSAEKHFTESVSAWYNLDSLLNTVYGKRLEDLTLNFDSNGKPTAEQIYFSISHTKNQIAVCVADFPCGIDVEFMSENRDFAKLSAFIGEQIDEKEEFYKTWTRREAAVKLCGQNVLQLESDDIKYRTFSVGNYMVTVSAKQDFNIIEK